MGVGATLAVRLGHLAAIPFTWWAALGLPLAVACWAALRRAPDAATREGVLVAASVVALAVLGSPVLAATWLAYAVAFRAVVDGGLPRAARVAGVVALLAAMVAAPVWAIAWLGTRGRFARDVTAFATNVALLRFWAYAADRAAGAVPALPLRRYLVAMLFFPTFVNGPIEPSRALAEPWPAPDAGDLGAGLRRVGLGVARMLLVGVAFAPGWTGVLAAAPTASAARLWCWGALLYVWFFLSFAAWSDVAIGLGRVCGRRVAENFRQPWMAGDVADFWHRWHVSLGHWLRDYVYFPLGGGRRCRIRNVLVVFAVSAAWHVWGTLKLLGFGYYPPAAWISFGAWGLLHGLAVAYGPRAGRGPVLAWRAGTFAFAAWAWIPFFLPGGVGAWDGGRVLLRMLLPWT